MTIDVTDGGTKKPPTVCLRDWQAVDGFWMLGVSESWMFPEIPKFGGATPISVK